MGDYFLIIIFFTGILSGFLNTVGGGGSLIAMPVLIFFGMPSALANGTNRIALVVQNIVAVAGFRHYGFFDLRFGLLLGIPAVIGSLLGASLAITLPDELFNTILAIIMFLVLFIILFEPHKRFLDYNSDAAEQKKWLACIVFFFIGIYGGFIQAGVGFIIIASLSVLTGLSLVHINSLKVFVVGLYITVSLSVFVFSGNVDWVVGIILAVGNGIGAWLGSVFAVKKSEKWIKAILAVTVTAMAIRLLI